MIVDNAHGAHLFFLDRKLHPLSQGAAMCADSAHKTLPVLTGGAYFQIGSGRYLPQVRAAMALFGSTSPSFPILLSLDLCRAWLEEEGKAAYAKTAAQANELNAYAQTLGFLPPEGLCDPLHLVWNTAHAGVSGKRAALHLRSAGIEVEYADEAFLILLLSPFNTEKDFAQLRAALTTMPVGEPFSPPPLCCPPRRLLLHRPAKRSFLRGCGSRYAWRKAELPLKPHAHARPQFRPSCQVNASPRNAQICWRNLVF